MAELKHPHVIKHIRCRKEWRTRAVRAAANFANHKAGRASREDLRKEMTKSMTKVAHYHGRRARAVIIAIQRRALHGAAK